MKELFRFLFSKNTLFYNSKEQRQYLLNIEQTKGHISANHLRLF